MKTAIAFLVLLQLSTFSPAAPSRTWTDSTGRYKLDASLVAYNDSQAVLKRADHQMVAMPLDKLSEQDRQYIQSKEASDLSARSLAGKQTWTLRDGTKLVGRIVDFASRDITLQLRRGRTYVNDRPLANLPEFYRLIVPRFALQMAKQQGSDAQSLEAFLTQQPGHMLTVHVDGVVLETESGDEFVVPMTLFADNDQRLLKQGWDEWLAAQRSHNYQAQDDNAFLLRTLLAERQRDEQVNRQIALMQLQMQAVQAGVTSLWEVTLYPANGQGRPRWVVMPGRNSLQATEAALQQNPGYVAGPVRRVSI